MYGLDKEVCIGVVLAGGNRLERKVSGESCLLFSADHCCCNLVIGLGNFFVRLKQY